MNIKHYNVNIAKPLYEIEVLNKYKKDDYFIVGIEITNTTIQCTLDINVDPQHNKTNKHNITALEYVFLYKDRLKKICSTKKNVLFVYQKTDIDSIGTGVILSLILQNKIFLNNDSILRLKAIANSDKHGRISFNRNLIQNINYNEYGIPIALLTIISDMSINLENKIKTMCEYIQTGNFEKYKFYQKKALLKLKNAKQNTTVEVIIPNKLVFITSTYRGAIGLGYKSANVVLALNTLYQFGYCINKKIGNKYTIAQHHDGYINLNSVNAKINEIEAHWGGSNTIIGSPQTKPSTLTKTQLVNILKTEIA